MIPVVAFTLIRINQDIDKIIVFSFFLNQQKLFNANTNNHNEKDIKTFFEDSSTESFFVS